MKIFKKIKLANKIIDTYNEIEDIIKSNKPVANDLKNKEVKDVL